VPKEACGPVPKEHYTMISSQMTTLAILPRRMRHDQPNERSQRPCGRAAGWRPPAAPLARPLLTP
jgi:hypothetical protein